MKNENVLCVPLNDVKRAFGLEREYWKAGVSEINSLTFLYISRLIAEKDFTHKQLIPYIIVFNDDDEVLVYRRCGSEKRLSGMLSAGIGGHVNDGDEGIDLFERLLNGLIREFFEELGVKLNKSEIRLLGMINEEKSEVGHCHIGVVFKVQVHNMKKLRFDSEIGEHDWICRDKINLSECELWSSLALQLENEY